MIDTTSGGAAATKNPREDTGKGGNVAMDT